MDWREFDRIYWRMYKRLEEDFFSTDSFCAIDNLNSNAYSARYLQQLLSIGSEVDVVSKAICHKKGLPLPGNRLGIYVWGKALFAEFPNYQDESIAAFEYEIAAVTPWHDLIIGKQTPQWWEVYNDVKHHRAENKNWCKATQSMVFQALCGLYVAVEYLVAVTFYKDEQEQKNNNEMGRFRSEHLQIANWLP